MIGEIEVARQCNKSALTNKSWRGAWVAYSVRHLTLVLAQLMISHLVSLSPASGSVLTVLSLLGILSLSLLPPLLMLSLSFSLSK